MSWPALRSHLLTCAAGMTPDGVKSMRPTSFAEHFYLVAAGADGEEVRSCLQRAGPLPSWAAALQGEGCRTGCCKSQCRLTAWDHAPLTAAPFDAAPPSRSAPPTEHKHTLALHAAAHRHTQSGVRAGRGPRLSVGAGHGGHWCQPDLLRRLLPGRESRGGRSVGIYKLHAGRHIVWAPAVSEATPRGAVGGSEAGAWVGRQAWSSNRMAATPCLNLFLHSMPFSPSVGGLRQLPGHHHRRLLPHRRRRAHRCTSLPDG